VEQVAVPTWIWLYLRFQYAGKVCQPGFRFRSLVDSTLKFILRNSRDEFDVFVRQVFIPGEHTDREIEGRSHVLNRVPNNGREFIMRRDGLTAGDPADIPGFQIQVRNDYIGLQLLKPSQQSAILRDVCFGPV
jgi:hypothetical protein